MLHTILITFHVIVGTISILAGATAMALAKGSPRHKLAGKIFVVSILAMTTSGGVIALMMPVSISVIVAMLTFYLVVTSVLVLQRKPKQTGVGDIFGLLVVASLSVAAFYYGRLAAASETGTIQGINIPTQAYYFFSFICAFCALSDLRFVLIGGLHGPQRIARHLWRMGLAMFIATSSLFTGQPDRFPEYLEDSGLLSIPEKAVLILIGFWLLKTLLWPTVKRLLQSFQSIVTRGG